MSSFGQNFVPSDDWQWEPFPAWPPFPVPSEGPGFLVPSEGLGFPDGPGFPVPSEGPGFPVPSGGPGFPVPSQRPSFPGRQGPKRAPRALNVISTPPPQPLYWPCWFRPVRTAGNGKENATKASHPAALARGMPFNVCYCIKRTRHPSKPLLWLSCDWAEALINNRNGDSLLLDKMEQVIDQFAAAEAAFKADQVEKSKLLEQLRSRPRSKCRKCGHSQEWNLAFVI